MCAAHAVDGPDWPMGRCDPLRYLVAPAGGRHRLRRECHLAHFNRPSVALSQARGTVHFLAGLLLLLIINLTPSSALGKVVRFTDSQGLSTLVPPARKQPDQPGSDPAAATKTGKRYPRRPASQGRPQPENRCRGRGQKGWKTKAHIVRHLREEFGGWLLSAITHYEMGCYRNRHKAQINQYGRPQAEATVDLYLAPGHLKAAVEVLSEIMNAK